MGGWPEPVEVPLPSIEPSESPSPTPSRSFAREAILIGLLSLTLNLAGNGRVSLWDRDEPRYAGCTREMRASGDWIHPTFNAEPRYHKPVLIYWLMLAGTAIGGDNPFGARLVSSVMGAATVLLTWAWGRRAIGPRAGRLAALVLATAPIMIAESKLATTDATLTFFVVACQFALWELSQRASRTMALAFWVSLGLAILTKSPAGPVLIGASFAMSWLCGGPTAFLTRLHWRWGPLVCAAIFVPWNALILLDSAGEYYNVAIGYHVIRRATTGIEEHGGFPGYYIATSTLTFFPWSALLPASVYAAWKSRRETPMAGFLLGWVLGPLILLECVRTKLIHYYLPAFPAASLLVAWQVVRAVDARSAIKDWVMGRFALITIGLIGGTATAGLIVAGVRFPSEMRAPCLATAFVMGTSTIVGLRLLMTGRVDRAIPTMVGFSALTMLMIGAWLLPSAEPFRISALVGRRLAAIEADVKVKPVLCVYQLPGVVFALGHPAPILRGRTALIEAVDREGAVLTAFQPEELKAFRKDPRMAIDLRETVDGFNVDKARHETLYLAVVRPGPAMVAERYKAAKSR